MLDLTLMALEPVGYCTGAVVGLKIISTFLMAWVKERKARRIIVKVGTNLVDIRGGVSQRRVERIINNMQWPNKDAPTSVENRATQQIPQETNNDREISGGAPASGVSAALEVTVASMIEAAGRSEGSRKLQPSPHYRQIV